MTLFGRHEGHTAHPASVDVRPQPVDVMGGGGRQIIEHQHVVARVAGHHDLAGGPETGNGRGQRQAATHRRLRRTGQELPPQLRHLLTGLMQLEPQSQQGHPQRGRHEPAAAPALQLPLHSAGGILPGQQPAAQPRWWLHGGGQRQRQQFQGGLEFIQACAQSGVLLQQAGQPLAFAGIQVAQGMTRQKGIDVFIAAIIVRGHGSLRKSISSSRRRINPCRALVLTVPRGTRSRSPIAD